MDDLRYRAETPASAISAGAFAPEPWTVDTFSAKSRVTVFKAGEIEEMRLSIGLATVDEL